MRIALAALLALALTAAAAPAADRDAARRGADWLGRQQPVGGGNGADALVALKAAGRLTPAQASGRAAALRADAPTYATSAGATAKTILGLVAAGSGNPRCAGDLDLLARLKSFAGAGGRFGRSAWDQALALIALRALGERPPRAAARFLSGARGPGGWNFGLQRNGRDDVTHTALAILGLRAAGIKASSATVRAGIAWMLRQRANGGGFAHERRDRSEANATALALEALRAAGRRDARAERALRALQRDDGSFQLAASDPGSRELATVDAVVALAGARPPVAALRRVPGAC